MWAINDQWEWARLIAGRGRDGDDDIARAQLTACATDAREVGMTRIDMLATELIATLD
jgi:hypothetical protein